jgi:uncharacterized protein YacL
MIRFARLIFLGLVSLVAIVYITASQTTPSLIIMVGSVVVAFAIITADILVKKKNLGALSGVMFGLLVGLLVSIGLGYLLEQVAKVLLFDAATLQRHASLLDGAKLLLSLMVCYTTVSFILQTKDDFRFIIPYVEFQRATKGPRPIILDTSVIIDGRIADMATTGMFESTLIVPRFVLNELQTIADSGDRLKRSRGRRGLEVLEKLKALPRLELRFWDGTLTQLPRDEDPAAGVDQKLVLLAQQEHGRIMTNDYNLNKVAGLRGVSVININSIAEALKPVVLPGESMLVRIIKPGENAGQGVGYLPDGTMVVVEGARDKVGLEAEVVVTNMIQNAAGKMIFGRLEGIAPRSESAKTRVPLTEPPKAAATKPT